MQPISRRCSVCHAHPNRHSPKVISSNRCPTLHVYCEKCFAAQPETFTCASPFCDQILNKSDFKETAVDSEALNDRVTATSKRIKCPVHKRASVSVCPAPKCPQKSRLICPYCIEENAHGRCMDRYHICVFLLQAKPILFTVDQFREATDQLRSAGLEVYGLSKLWAFAKQVAEEALEVPLKKELVDNLEITLSPTGQLLYKTARVAQMERFISAIRTTAKPGVAQSTLEGALRDHDKFRFLSFGLKKELISHDNVYGMHRATREVIDGMNHRLFSENEAIRNVMRATLPRPDVVRGQLAPVRDALAPLKKISDNLASARSTYNQQKSKQQEYQKTVENIIEQRAKDRADWRMLREAGYLQEISGGVIPGGMNGPQWGPSQSMDPSLSFGIPPSGY